MTEHERQTSGQDTKKDEEALQDLDVTESESEDVKGGGIRHGKAAEEEGIRW